LEPHVRDHPPESLEVSDRAPELLALTRVPYRRLEGALRDPERHRGGAEPLTVVGRHERLEAAGGGQGSVSPDATAVEDDLTCGDPAHPHGALAPRDGHAWCAGLDDERPDSCRPGNPIEPAQDHVGLGDARARDPTLRAGEDPRAALALRPRREI